MNPKYEIVFDVFGVLLSRGFASSAVQLSNILNKTVEEIRPVCERWGIPFDLGSLSEKRFWELVQQDLGTNIDWEKLNNIVKSSYYPIDGSIELLQKYSELTDCYLLSNTRREWFEYLDSIYHITTYVKYAFLSYKIKNLKPNLDIFLKVIKQIGAEPRHIIFIDDSIENIRAALTTGMQAHHFNDAYSAEKFIERLTMGSS